MVPEPSLTKMGLNKSYEEQPYIRYLYLNQYAMTKPYTLLIILPPVYTAKASVVWRLLIGSNRTSRSQPPNNKDFTMVKQNYVS